MGPPPGACTGLTVGTMVMYSKESIAQVDRAATSMGEGSMRASLSGIVAAFDAAGQFNAPPQWRQGRTVYGGLTAALALQAALSCHGPALPPLKSAQIAFVGPASGPLRFAARLIRQGKSATWVSAECLAGNDVCLQAQFLFAAPRPAALRHVTVAFPEVDAPGAYRPLEHGGLAPASIGNFDLRPVGSSLPYSGAPQPQLLAWVRHQDADGVDPSVALLALADGLPPAAVASLSRPALFSSMTWSVDLAAPARPGTWYLMRSTSQQADDGYSFQRMEMWDEAGSLVLSGSQTVGIYA